MLDRPGAWLRRKDVERVETITSGRLHEMLAETAGPGPSADELAFHLARIGGQRELFAALLIRATALGYPQSTADPLHAIGELAAARLEVEGRTYESRIQGGVLADGCNGVLAALCTITPMTTFAQNNGVIALTKCANRKAGYCCW